MEEHFPHWPTDDEVEAAIRSVPTHFVDVVVTAANVISQSGAAVRTGTAGATVTAGQVVYEDASDSGKFKLADANVTALTAAAVGIALHASLAGQPLTIQMSGLLSFGAVLVVGETYILSATPGGFAPAADLAAGWFATHLGIATTTSLLSMLIRQSGVAKA